jgi:hypothetical protein
VKTIALLAYLSNPQVNYLNTNVPTGTADRDNARVVRENARVIANYRSRTALMGAV